MVIMPFMAELWPFYVSSDSRKGFLKGIADAEENGGNVNEVTFKKWFKYNSLTKSLCDQMSHRQLLKTDQSLRAI